MPKSIFNSDGLKFTYREAGTTAPIYTIYGKNEADAFKTLSKYLERFGNSDILHKMELVENE